MREFRLDPETRAAIVEAAGSDGFVQVLITRYGEEPVHGVDDRARPRDFNKLPPLELLAVNELTTILGSASCHAGTKLSSNTGSHLSGWDLDDPFCN